MASAGEPRDVLEYLRIDKPVDPPFAEQLVQVRMLHAPWNPADANTAQGRYASPYVNSSFRAPDARSPFFEGRTVLGSEGWGRVVSSDSMTLPEGSLVTVGLPGLGTLRSSLWVPEDSLLPVPNLALETLGPSGSSLFQLGGTALRMLTDFVPLRPGDVLLQNAGNSGVGLLVSQLASALFQTSVVSLVRRGSRSTQEFEEMVHFLSTKGKNDLVVAEEDLEKDVNLRKDLVEKIRHLSPHQQPPRLALNAVGGHSAKSLLRLLGPSGTMVTYGGMSAQPVEVPTPQLIFKNLRLAGYWHSQWMVDQPQPFKEKLVHDLVAAVKDHDIVCPPCRVFPLQDVEEALEWQAKQGAAAIRSKLIFACEE